VTSPHLNNAHHRYKVFIVPQGKEQNLLNVIPLNTNALKCFFKLLTDSNEGALEIEVIKELHDLISDSPGKVGYAFENLFGLNILYRGGDIALNYQSIDGVIWVLYFLTSRSEGNHPRLHICEALMNENRI
jgi:hypothetical protein